MISLEIKFHNMRRISLTPSRRDKSPLGPTPSKAIHSQTLKFISRHYSGEALCIHPFASILIQQYEHLWAKEGTNFEADFATQLEWTFGEFVGKKALIDETKEDGMVGLILATLKRIRKDSSRLQNLKNIIRQFMEAMHKCIEDSLCSKFNTEMRRMVLKCRESEKIIRRVNELINHNADLFQLEKQHQESSREAQRQLEELKREKERLAQQLHQQNNKLHQQIRENEKLKLENAKLSSSLEKIQEALLKKALGTEEGIRRIKPFMVRRDDKENTCPNLSGISSLHLEK